MLKKRICIYTSDVQWITGRNESAARRLLRKLRQKLNKTREQFVTIDEFAEYTGINPDQIQKYIDD
jgi:hypothetical protein